MSNFQTKIGKIRYNLSYLRGGTKDYHYFAFYRNDEPHSIGGMRIYYPEDLFFGKIKREFVIYTKREFPEILSKFLINYTFEKRDDSFLYIFQTLSDAHFFYEEIKKEKEKTEIRFNLLGNSKVGNFQNLPIVFQEKIDKIVDELEILALKKIKYSAYSEKISKISLDIVEVATEVKDYFSHTGKIIVFGIETGNKKTSSLNEYSLERELETVGIKSILWTRKKQIIREPKK